MNISMYKTIAITNRKLVQGDFLTQIRKICGQKVDMILLREPDLSQEMYVELAKKVKAICDEHQVELRWHFFAKEAQETGEKSIHLPLTVLEKKNKKICFEIISTSVHSVEEARRGKASGATELLVSNIYRTNCKPGVEGKGLLLIEKIKSETGLPVYALGGIDRDKISSCINAGADGICMMSELMK